MDQEIFGSSMFEDSPRQTRSSPKKKSAVAVEEEDVSYSRRRVVTKSKRYQGDEWVDSSPVKVKSEQSSSNLNEQPPSSPAQSNSRTNTPRPKKTPVKPVLMATPEPKKPTQVKKVHNKKSPLRVSPVKKSPAKKRPIKVKVDRIKEITSMTDDEERPDDFGESLEEEALDMESNLHLINHFAIPAHSIAPAKSKGKGQEKSTEDLSQTLRDGLRHLKNLLKLPKARRWVYCELFYSEIDRELFLGRNEFQQCLRESFPNLVCTSMTRKQWHHIRRLIGKPRRCSQSFFEEEMESLVQKRSMLREIYRGTCIVSDEQLALLPEHVRPLLTVGAKICARIRSPKDGLYVGTVDAILPNGYRIVFEKDTLPAQVVLDTEVMAEKHEPIVPLTHLIDKAKAKAFPAMRTVPSVINVSPMKTLPTSVHPALDNDPLLTASTSAVPPSAVYFQQGPKITQTQLSTNDKVGNFPGKLLVIIVKISKLLDVKRCLVNQLKELNSEAEKMNLLLTDAYPKPFQERYAQVVVDLDALNLQLEGFLSGICDYRTQLLPHASQVPVASRPEALQRLCSTQAAQIVRHCNNGLQVDDKPMLQLITSLTALLLQMRSLGQTNSTPLELSSLSASLTSIKGSLHPSNVAAFQDHVEVHMKHIHQTMLSSMQSHSAFDSIFR